MRLSSEMHAVLDVQGYILAINPVFVQCLRSTEEQLAGTDFKALLTPSAQELLTHTIQQALQQPDQPLPIKLDLQLADKQQQSQIKGRLLANNGQLYLVANLVVLQDAPLARFRRFFDMSLLDIVIILDQERRIIYANQGFSDMLGYLWRDTKNQPFDQFIHPEDSQIVIQAFDELKLAEGITKRLINRILLAEGGCKWIAWSALFAKGYYYVIANDVTENKQQELRITELLSDTMYLNQQLARQNEELSISRTQLTEAMKELEVRNFELDQFVYRVSHDLRAPLASILGLINLAKIDPNKTANFPRYLEMMSISIERLEQFITSLLDYSKGGRADSISEEIQFQLIIQEVLNDLKFAKYLYRLKIDTYIEPELKFINEPMRVRIIFSNIISNAVKFQNLQRQENWLKIRIESSSEEPDVISISFQDNGIGISQEVLNNIFSMFYRGTEMSDGAGLGLYIVKQTVERLNGKVVLNSVENEGTNIRILLPNLKA